MGKGSADKDEDPFQGPGPHTRTPEEANYGVPSHPRGNCLRDLHPQGSTPALVATPVQRESCSFHMCPAPECLVGTSIGLVPYQLVVARGRWDRNQTSAPGQGELQEQRSLHRNTVCVATLGRVGQKNCNTAKSSNAN
ncbi:hypothetical protein NDU88_010112 [Pleurodeles waltl]|uniref:Uncharacterized protein n=1 Tax=Pleurodeles waltl TaxID=8319 RepID=A0AAV7QXQ0_PLEWA|nr:hypothetical protein NDU88_010112 [Pleurodeles waltl]